DGGAVRRALLEDAAGDELAAELEEAELLLEAGGERLLLGGDAEQAAEEGGDVAGDGDEERGLLGRLEALAGGGAVGVEALGEGGVGGSQVREEALVQALEAGRAVEVLEREAVEAEVQRLGLGERTRGGGGHR